MIRFSIITICLNEEDEIENTITSVLNQTCTDFEYLIKDGLSKDRTVSIAQTFAPAFAEKGIPFRIISKADRGIYDAMNQAVCEVKGQWVLFMNAGDMVADKHVLSLVEKSGYLETADIIYGDRICRDNKWCGYQKAFALEEMRVGLPFCHQSIFTKRELFEKNDYSLKYKICSAFRFYLQMYREGKKFAYIPEALSITDINGVSSNWKLSYPDRIKILEEMPVRDEEAIQRVKKMMREKYRQEFMHQHLWKYIPKKLRMKRRELMRKRAGWKIVEDFFEETEK